MTDIVEAYTRTRGRMCGLIADADGEERGRTVPACPDWSVHDLLAHVVSIPAALSSGRLPGGPIGEWLDELIAERQDASAESLIAEWQALDAALPSLLQGPSAVLYGDLAVHEHDLRGALDKPDHAALEIDTMLPRTLAAFSAPLREAALAPIAVTAGDLSWQSHAGTPGWTLLTDPWTAVRALNSRRTADELRGLPAEGDVEPYLAVIDAHLPLPAQSLGE